jgi:hypothetical protein
MDSGQIHLEEHLGEIEKRATIQAWNKPNTTKPPPLNYWG